MADETASTETSTTETTATDVAAETAATEAVESKDDGLGGTALGDAGEDAAEAKDDAATEGAETEAKAEVPESYELTVPEGFEKLDDTTVSEATPVLKELGLTNEQANKLVPVVASFAKRIVERRDQAFLGAILEQRKAWSEEAKADKEIGGGNWDATMRAAAKFMDAMGSPPGSPLRAVLKDSGLEFHPELIRIFAKAGRAIGEDTDFVRSDADAGVKAKSDAELFYGKRD